MILAITIAGFFYYRIDIKNWWMDFNRQDLPIALEYNKPNVTTQGKNSEPVPEDKFLGSGDGKINETNQDLNYLQPTTYNLSVPFTSQAPFANWDETFKEGCEEASVLMVHYFYNNDSFTAQLATDEILAMVDWQLNYFGGHFDLTAEQTAEMIKKYFGYKKVEVIKNPTVDDIKNHISKQRPVIIPAAGKMLGNPYFIQPGPNYHMLVIKGYTKTDFITNDPGTKRGEDFLYSYDTIMEAMHDWNKEDINLGAKKIIIIYP